MKIFIEEYGLAILSAVVILMMILFISPLGQKVWGILNQEGEVAGETVEKTSIYVDSTDMVEIRSVIVKELMANEGSLENFSIVAEQYKTQIRALTQSSGFISPIDATKYGLTAKPWHYDEDFGGDVHLGLDYGAAKGTDVIAPANGVVISAGDGCGDGFLGCMCKGNGYRMTSGGGNQLYFITSINVGGIDRVYVFAFFHLLDGTVTHTGVYQQGDKLAEVGTSGNSTGPHCHIEVYYLGQGDFQDIESIFLRNTYTPSFGCGWGEYGLAHTCETSVDIVEATSQGNTCRIDPRRILPQKEDDKIEGYCIWE